MKILLIFSCTKGHQGRGQKEEPSTLEVVLHSLALSYPHESAGIDEAQFWRVNDIFYIRGPQTRKDSHPNTALKL